MNQFNIKILNEKNGILFQDSFSNQSQFKLFLKMIQGCIELKNDLTFFNGTDFLIHIPNKILVESIITTNVVAKTLTEHLSKSKIEAIEI